MMNVPVLYTPHTFHCIALIFWAPCLLLSAKLHRVHPYTIILSLIGAKKRPLTHCASLASRKKKKKNAKPIYRQNETYRSLIRCRRLQPLRQDVHERRKQPHEHRRPRRGIHRRQHSDRGLHQCQPRLDVCSRKGRHLQGLREQGHATILLKRENQQQHPQSSTGQGEAGQEQ